MKKDKHTPFCIICGESFSDKVRPSKEHIIPEALGNERLVTDYILVKIIRKSSLEKDKDLQIFDSAMTDDKGNKYRITDQGPEIFPNVDINKEKQKVHMEVASLEEGKKIAKGILKKGLKRMMMR